MAIAVSSVTSAAVSTQTSVSAPRDTASSSDPFQAILAQTTTAAQSPQTAREANQAALNAEAADQIEDDQTDDATTASDAAVAQLAAQLGLTQLATTNTPISTDGTPLATSQTASDAQKLTAPELHTAAQLGLPVQTDSLFQQAAANAGLQNSTQLPDVAAQTPQPADAVPTAPAPVATSPNAVPVPAVEAPQTATATQLPIAVAAAQSSQRQVVPAQAPIVSGLQPTPPAPTTNPGLPTPVVAPQAPVEAAGVPTVTVGDRPGTAGDQFAAIASTATTLLPPPAQVASDAFAQALAGTDAANAAATNAVTLVPNQLAESTESNDRFKASDFGDTTQVAGSPTFAQPQQSPNSVTAAQTPTAVKTPDVVTQVADHIVTHAHVVARGGETEFRMRLDPPELGALKIRLVSDGDSIHGQVVVSSDAVRRMIESQLPELRQRLEDAGVSVQNFNVTTDANPGTSGGGGEWGGYRSEFPSEQARSGATAPAPRPVAARSRGAIDVMA